MTDLDDLRAAIADAETPEERLRHYESYDIMEIFGHPINAVKAHAFQYGVIFGLWLGLLAGVTGNVFLVIILAGSLISMATGIRLDYLDQFNAEISRRTGSLAVLKVERKPHYFSIGILASLPIGTLLAILMVWLVSLV